MDKKNLPEYANLDSIKKEFSLPELVQLSREENFAEWLTVNLYAGEAQQLLDIVENDGTDAEVAAVLCKIFKYKFDELSDNELSQISAVINRARARVSNKAVVVENQADLAHAIWATGSEVICLNGGEFKIALGVPNKTYKGFNNAVVDIFFDKDIDLDAQNITLENLQVCLRSPIQIKMDNYKNVKVINAFKTILNENISADEIADVLRGRSPFESAEQFRARAENIKGLAVGTVLLEDKNYKFDEQTFKIAPEWNFDYISVLRDFTANKSFTLKIAPADAEKLYADERKLQIFADLTFADNKLTIASLYLETQSAGRVYLEKWN